MMRQSRGVSHCLVVIALGAFASCSGDEESAVTTSTAVASTDESSADTEPDTLTPGTAQTTTTVPVPEVAAPGVQYGAPVPLPAGIAQLGEGVARDGILYVPGVNISPVDNTVLPRIISVAADGTSQVIAVDDNSNFALPPGFGYLRGFSVNHIASGPAGLVAVGTASITVDRSFSNVTSQSLIWFSPDGVTWQRFDPRELTGNIPLQLVDVRSTPDGFLATGAIADGFDLNADRTDIAVLASPDGVTWRLLNRITSTWSVDPGSVGMVDGKIVVLGVEYACTADSGHLATFSTGSQFRAWHSSDDGSTWTVVTGPSTGLVVEPEPAPTDPALCPSRDDMTAFFDETEKRYNALPANSAITDQGVVVVERGGERVAVSSDLATWTTATTAHRLPTQVDDISTTSSKAGKITTQGDELVLLSLEPLRNDDNEQSRAGAYQVYSWRSSDVGASWTEQPRGRPLLPQQISQLRFQVIGDETIALFDIGGQAGAGPNFAFFSTAAELVDYRICAPAPGAACSFAESFDPPIAAGADLTGIDLRWAALGEDVDLSGAMLANVRLDGARIAGDLKAADLTGASLVDVRMSDSDLTGATFASANLSGADVNATLVDADFETANITKVTIGIRSGDTLSGADFSGLDLSGMRFTSFAEGTAPMAGARFTGANLTGASFFRVDLTGADFTDAVFNIEGGPEPSFTEVRCPDLVLSDAALTGRAACRL